MDSNREDGAIRQLLKMGHHHNTPSGGCVPTGSCSDVRAAFHRPHLGREARGRMRDADRADAHVGMRQEKGGDARSHSSEGHLHDRPELVHMASQKSPSYTSQVKKSCTE